MYHVFCFFFYYLNDFCGCRQLLDSCFLTFVTSHKWKIVLPWQKLPISLQCFKIIPFKFWELTHLHASILKEKKNFMKPFISKLKMITLKLVLCSLQVNMSVCLVRDVENNKTWLFNVSSRQTSVCMSF